MPFPPLQYKSDKGPVPLSKLETALLCFAGAGTTGMVLTEITPGFGANTTMHWSARAFPSPCNNHRTHLIFTDDDGLYLYEPALAKKVVEVETLSDLEERVNNFDKEIVKLKDGRLDLAPRPPATWTLNSGMINRRGQTMFMPIVDPAYEMIDMALVSIQFDHYLFYDDITGKAAGVEKWIDKLGLNVRVPISTLDSGAVVSCSLEAGFICQNILLMAQAIGLGAFPFSGYAPLVIMGGTPITRGLGFRYVTDKKGMPNPVGIDGILEGYCPPYKTMDEAVDAIVEQKYGSGGIFTAESTELCAYKDPKSIVEAMAKDKIPDDVIQCTKDLCNYIYEKYGRFPATIDTMSLPIMFVAHHIDTDFYKKYYAPGAVTENQETHISKWHST
jgi:nitroreductase